MHQNRIHRIVGHLSNDTARPPLPERLAEFHAEVIERRLAQSGLPVDQQLAALNRIILHLQEQEVKARH